MTRLKSVPRGVIGLARFDRIGRDGRPRPAKMNPTEPVKRLKFGFIFLCPKYGFKSQANSKRDLNPCYYFLYDLRLSVDLMFNFLFAVS